MKDLFHPPRNCRRVATASRAALLVDGETYFGALHAALLRARRTIFIVGWDLHSELRLVRGSEKEVPPQRLGPLLDALARRRKALRIYLLSWDFAMIYTMEREFFPRYKFHWRTHRRIHHALDGEHPVGASQHQKIVVVDDAVAFSGGFDLGQWRWDSTDHRPHDPRRVDPENRPYAPFHDVQMAVDGEAARTLGEIVRERWQRVCGGKWPAEVPAEVGDPWPPGVTPQFRDVPVAVARTLPAFKGQEEVREVERLFLDSIAAARRFIYVENQYLSAFRVGEALKDRLMEADGPEVVLVLPQRTGGWLEQHSMDVLRGRLLRKLRQADHHGRLQVYYPRIAIDPPVSLMVHAKVMVIDDRLVRVGSANLSNRSLGLDSECDLAIAAEAGSIEEKTIAAFRNRLLAEHLGTDADRVAREIESRDSLIAAVEALRRGARTLVPLDGEISPEVDRWVPDAELLDPERPIAPEALFDRFVSPRQEESGYRHIAQPLLLLAGLVGLAALWRWTALGEWVALSAALAVFVFFLASLRHWLRRRRPARSERQEGS